MNIIKAATYKIQVLISFRVVRQSTSY